MCPDNLQVSFMRSLIVGLFLVVFHYPRIGISQKSPRIDDSSFSVKVENEELYLLYQGQKVLLAQGDSWNFADFDYSYVEYEPIQIPGRPVVSDLPEYNVAKAIKLAHDEYLVLISFYEAPIDATMARGIDILVVLNTKTNSFWPVNEKLVPSIGRGSGPCRNAKMATYLIKDIDEDKKLDIGVLTERIACDFDNDLPSNPYYTQDPIIWYTNNHELIAVPSNFWVANRKYEGHLPKTYLELKSLSRTPVDVMGSSLWKTSDRLKWPTNLNLGKMVLTNNQSKSIRTDAKKRNDKVALSVLKAHQYESHRFVWQAYPTQQILTVSDSLLKVTLGLNAQYFTLTDLFDGSDHHSSYTFLNDNYQAQKVILKRTDSLRTQGDFQEARIVYKIDHPSYSWADGLVIIQLDNYLRPLNPVSTVRIPQFILDNKRSDYLSAEEAIRLSKSYSKEFHHERIAQLKPGKSEDPPYYWNIQHIKKEQNRGSLPCWVVEEINLHPITGELMDRKPIVAMTTFVECP